MVRCGACKLTFNGIEHLLAPGEAPRTPVKVATSETLESAEAVKTTSKTSDNQLSSSVNFNSDSSSETAELSAPAEESNIPTPEFDTTLKSEPTADQELKQPTPSAVAVSADQNTAPSIEFSEVRSHDDTVNASHEPDFKVVPKSDFTSTVSSSVDFNNESKDSVPEEEMGTDQEVNSSDSIVVTEDDIDAFDQMFSLTSSSEQSVDAQPAAQLKEANQDAQTNLMKQFSAQLETIEPELGVPSEKEKTKRQAPGLTGKLEFELTSEEQALVEQAELLHQLELENRAAILDDDAKEWSRHEPSFDEIAPKEPSFQDQTAIEYPLFPKKTTNKPAKEESAESLTESGASLLDDTDDVTPEFVLLAEKKRRFGKWQTFGWSLSCFILMLAIALQSTYFFRSAIAAEWPATKPHLLRACQLLACQIKLPAQRQMLELVGSELLILNEELRINTLAFQIQNKSNTAQEWPALELTLKDLRGKTVLQKVFQPTEYLINKTDLGKGIAARSESNHKLHFELNTIKASNYEVGIFYP
jgi:hypothetical protein